MRCWGRRERETEVRVGRRVIRSVARRGAIINSDNSVAELQKIELPKAKKAKKAEKDVELKVVEEEVEEGTKTIVIEFFFRFFCFFFLGTLSLFGEKSETEN